MDPNRPKAEKEKEKKDEIKRTEKLLYAINSNR